MPFFVIEGRNVSRAVKSMPGVFQLSIDNLVKEVLVAKKLGIRAIILFGLPATKDDVGSGAYDMDGIVPKAVRALKEKVQGVKIITDVCLCQYTSHGHCGVLKGASKSKVAIDLKKTLKLLSATALAHARAGADMVAPSAMMRGQVRSIRKALDGAGYQDISIMGYSAKYASSFYGPFRDAAESAPKFGDRSSYQMDPRDAAGALKEVALDIKEGADIVMVKPALAYMDVIRQVKDRFDRPLAVYNVSGEYAMVKAAAAQGWVNERKVVLEILTGLCRAGADIIITYHACDVARWLKDKR
jgi:porphobilinogen synthase